MKRILLALLFCTGCATGVPMGARSKLGAAHLKPFGAPALARAIPREEPKAEPALTLNGDRRDVVELARSLVGKSSIRIDGKAYPDDCTGLVSGVYGKLGVGLLGEAKPGDNAVTAMYRFAQRHGRVFESGEPLPGDLVFFKETYDQNRDGRANDGLTHVGIVEETLADGTLVVIHRVKRGVVRYRMNLAHPSVRKDGSGKVLNDALRAAGASSREVLTGQLFAAFGALLPEGSAVASRSP